MEMYYHILFHLLTNFLDINLIDNIKTKNTKYISSLKSLYYRQKLYLVVVGDAMKLEVFKFSKKDSSFVAGIQYI